MSSGLHGHKLPNVRTWAMAERRFNQTAPVRGQDPDTRPLTENRSDRAKLLVRHERDGRVEYSCRYHNTDCITFRGDGTIHLIPWRSRNTDTFVSSILMLNTWYDHAMGMCVEIETPRMDQRVYRLSEYAERRGFTVTEGTQLLLDVEQMTQPMFQYIVNRTRANAIYKAAGLGPFTTWVKAAKALAPHVFTQGIPVFKHTRMAPEDLDRVPDPEQWTTLVTTYGPTVLDCARRTLIEEHGECIDRVEHRYATRETIDQYHSSAVKYARAYERATSRIEHALWLATL